MNEGSGKVRIEREWLGRRKGVRVKAEEDRKFSSTCRTRTHNLLLSRKAQYHCAKGETANGT